jgi:hypothetical protein
MAEYAQAFANSGAHTMHYSRNFEPWLKANKPELYAELRSAQDPPSIVQIKGPANRAPSKEALAMVQDLVKGGVPGLEQWGRVGDLQNTGLVHLSEPRRLDKSFEVPAGYYNPEELWEVFKERGFGHAEFLDTFRKLGGGSHYSSGGSVGDGSGPGDPASGIGPGSDAATDPGSIGAVNGADAASDAAIGTSGIASPSVGMGMPSMGTIGNAAALGNALGNLTGNQSLADISGQIGQAIGIGNAAVAAANGNPGPAVGVGVAAATGVPALGNMASEAVQGNTTGVIGAGIDGMLGVATMGLSGIANGISSIVGDPATNPSIGNQIAGIMSGEGNPSNTNPSSANATNGMDVQSDQGSISQGIMAAEAAAALAANMENAGGLGGLYTDWLPSETARLVKKYEQEEALRRYFGLSAGMGLPQLRLY